MHVPKLFIGIACLAILLLVVGGIVMFFAESDIASERADTLREEEQSEADNAPMTEIPAEARRIMLNVFFSKDDPAELDCTIVHAVPRTVTWTPGVARAALELLMEGPTPTEHAAGYTTSIPDGTTLQSIGLEDGVLSADFDDALNRGGGSCHVVAVRSQITETLRQFPTIREVVISVNGGTEEVLQP